MEWGCRVVERVARLACAPADRGGPAGGAAAHQCRGGGHAARHGHAQQPTPPPPHTHAHPTPPTPLAAPLLLPQAKAVRQREAAAAGRKDAKMAHVVISEKFDKKAAKLTTPALPFPYTSKEVRGRAPPPPPPPPRAAAPQPAPQA